MSDANRECAAEGSSPGRWRQAWIAVLLAAVAGGSWWLWQFAGSMNAEAPADAKSASHKLASVAPVETIVAEFVGSESCADCHIGEYESFAKTGHSRSLNADFAELEPAGGEFYHQRSGRHYRAYRDGGKLHHCESIRGESGAEIVLADHPVSMVVGSGNHAG